MQRLAALIITCLSIPAWGACTSPIAPTVPDGATATKERMVQGQTEIKVFMSVANEYLACVDEMMKGASEKAEKVELNKEYNTMVDQMSTIAKDFNASIRKFKEASK